MKDLFGYEPPAPTNRARKARDQALTKVAKNSGDWFGKAMQAVTDMPTGWRGIGEDLRLEIEARIGKPHHHNAWGSVTNQAVRRGLLIKTGTLSQMKTAKSHARASMIYVRS